MVDGLAPLRAELSKGPPRSLYVLVGEDVWAREEACRIIEEALAQQAGSFDRQVLFGDEAGPEAIMTAIGTGSLFQDVRVVIVRGFDRLTAADQDRVVPILSRLPTGVYTILTCRTADRRRSAFRELSRVGRWVSCDPPAPEVLPRWVAERARSMGLRLSAGAARLLIELTGPDPKMLDTELDKLAVYAQGQPVDEKTVQETASVAVPQAAEHAVFRMAEAVAGGRAEEALVLLDRLLAVGEPPLVVLSILARHFRLLALAAGSTEPAKELGARLGVPPFAAERLRRQAGAVGVEGAAAALRRILKADLEIKTGRDPRLTLETLVVTLAWERKSKTSSPKLSTR
ncbi:MAG: DNA polymerase III subunit delta [Firmicutes bacterium]|nr:DNA polymerase III subunit delta [Bacillota bacterium]